MGESLLLCRPQGGLNDMLSQVESCCRYAERTGRTVVVDTAYAGSSTFHDDFRNYFESGQSRLLLDASEVDRSLDEMTVAPEFLQGRVTSYTADRRPNGSLSASGKRELKSWMDTQTGLPLSFDFQKSYTQELLVHHAEGRNEVAKFALMRMRVVLSVSDELKRRLDLIGSPYDAIHIRNTDYTTSYKTAIEALRKAPPPKLFLATDNIAVLQEFREALGAERVFSYSWLPPTAGEPLHKTVVSGEERFNRNRDAIVDLLMLALSRQLMLARISEGPALSGFSQLAHSLWTSKIVVKHLLGRPDIKFGLD